MWSKIAETLKLNRNLKKKCFLVHMGLPEVHMCQISGLKTFPHWTMDKQIEKQTFIKDDFYWKDFYRRCQWNFHASKREQIHYKWYLTTENFLIKISRFNIYVWNFSSKRILNIYYKKNNASWIAYFAKWD